ncbi:semaphorin-7A [Mantella aurantiaca]
MNLRLAIFLGWCFSFSYTYVNVRMTPRLTQLNTGGWSFPLLSEQPYAMFYLDKPNSLYIGGEEVLYHYDFRTMTKYSRNADNYNCQGKTYCKNFVTFVKRLDGLNESLIVCGTNAYNPACWKMDGENFEKLSSSWAEQLSPRIPGMNYNILNTGNDMYSTIPRQSNNAASTKKATFRKIFGKDPMRYTDGNLLKNPVFVNSLVVEGEQKLDSRIFLFFMDDNSEHRTTDKRVPMIVRMCKEEMGSEKPDERNMFSTALKSRLICGNQKGQYYNFLQDIYFLKSQDLVYGLFTNAWNHSAVCSYKIENIELVFNTSDLFESSKKDLKIRPGKCLSVQTPQETAEEAANHPELVDWVWPLGNQTVFQTLDHYRKLVVDEITAVNKQIYRVIIVATDNGALHKVVELDDGALNVLEMQPFNKTGKILYLELNPHNTEHVLYVGNAYEVSRLPLDDCRAYNKSCTDCMISRDPYCGWYEGKCQSILNNRDKALQNLTEGAMCEQKSKMLPQTGLPYISSNEKNVLSQRVYHLTCQAESKQATYWWIYGNNHKERCTPQNGKCDLFLDHIKAHEEYKCVEEEFSRQRLVSEYKLTVENSSWRMQSSWLVLAIQVWIILISI